MSNKWLLLIIFGVSLITHFVFFGHPNQAVFDEVHFGKFISNYYTHEYYFDIHPPLGKLMIAGFAKIFNFSAKDGNFNNIGDIFPDKKYLALRFLPNLSGALLSVVIFLLTIQLGLKPSTAFMAGFLVAFENALVTQTHYILMDGFLLLFGFSTLLFYFKRNFIWMAIFGGLAISIKWTGLTFLALPFLMETYQVFKPIYFRTQQVSLGFWRLCRKYLLNVGVYFFVIPLVIYFSIFTVHFSLLTKPGPGDAFMGSNFQEKNLVQKFVRLNTEMYFSNQRLTATHPYGSQWYSWPFMTRPIFYWVSGDSRIYSLGNPIIWWSSTVAVVLLLLQSIEQGARSIKNKKSMFNVPYSLFLLGGYFLNLLPFIGIKRVMFLYHYLTALVFAILILVFIIGKQKNSRNIFIVLAITSILSFIYFSPLTYGLQLNPFAYNSRIWLPSWR